MKILFNFTDDHSRKCENQKEILVEPVLEFAKMSVHLGFLQYDYETNLPAIY